MEDHQATHAGKSNKCDISFNCAPMVAFMGLKMLFSRLQRLVLTSNYALYVAFLGLKCYF